MKNLSESAQKAMVNNINHNMASRADRPMSFEQGDEVAYLRANGELAQGIVYANGGETLCITNGDGDGDWCYVWGAINLSNARGL